MIMKLKEIHEQIRLAEAYKYTCELELEKQKRNNGIYHDFSDFDNFYKKQVDFYNKYIIRYHKMRLDKIGQSFNLVVSSIFVIFFIFIFILLR